MRVLFNPKSGGRLPLDRLVAALDPAWDGPGMELTYQVSHSAEDGRAKALRAVDDGIDTVLVVGGDGMINSIGGALVDTPVTLGVIPGGSGNGFARHFEIPLAWKQAAESLRKGRREAIDVGQVNGRSFFVTCSMAWDAELVKWFERSPVRGILPYVMSGAYGFLEYAHQPFHVAFDGGASEVYQDPTVFTVANLTQYGAGVRIAPGAREDDGLLELVAIGLRDAPAVLARLSRFFDGTLNAVREVRTRSFRTMTVWRERAAPIQIDGELLPPVREVHIGVKRQALHVLVPA